MDSRVELVFKKVYRNEGVWENDMDNGLWNRKLVCLLGFEEEIKSGKDLILSLISALISRGGNVVKYPNKNFDTKLVESIDYYICNYGLGYDIRPLHVIDYKFVTPIWLYSCNRDNFIYNTDALPIFKATRQFYGLKFIGANIKLSIIDTSSVQDHRKTKPAKLIKYSLDTITRFIRHCGFTFVHYNDIKNGIVDLNGTIYFLMCRSLNKEIDQSLINLSNKIPCISIQWLYDSYSNGDLEDINKYLVKIETFTTKLNTSGTSNKRRKSERSRRSVYNNRVLCISYICAVENDLNSMSVKDLGALSVFVVNPVHVLAPWSVEDITNDAERKMYNTLSLVDDKELVLVLSEQESKNNAIGLFTELSMLLNNSKGNKRLIRGIDTYKSLKLPSSYAAQKHLIQIPQELLEGNSIIGLHKGRDSINNFNLYDLADSITFVEIENLSQHQEETIDETNRQINENVDEYCKLSKEAEVSWNDMLLASNKSLYTALN